MYLSPSSIRFPMARSTFHCPHVHDHGQHRYHCRKHHSHDDLTLPHSRVNIREDWRSLIHSEDQMDATSSQLEDATEYDMTETTTEQSCIHSTTLKSKTAALRHEAYPLHVSVNLRISGTNTVLLPEDVFIPIAGSESLASIFEAALFRYPQQVGRYILRQEKEVVILCHDEAKNTYSKTSVVFAALSRLRPIRLIFCVVPNVQVIRELDSRKDYMVKINARTESDPDCIFEKDITVEAQGNVSARQLWANFAKSHPQIHGLNPTGVLTRRPDDNVVVRFGMHDFVADLVKSRGRRFIFILTGHLPRTEQRRYTEHGCAKHEGHRNKEADNRMRFKLWLRFRPYRLGQGKRMFQLGLLQKKNESARG